jgi:ParB/RepB/Spo0J family partition protein
MTLAPTRPAGARLTREQVAILSRYAGGERAASIAAATGLALDTVGHILDEHAGNNPGLARRLVDEYTQQAQTVAAAKGRTTAPRPRPAAPAEHQAGQPVVLNGVLLRLPLDLIKAGSNARGADLGDLTELAMSLQTLGQQKPVIVCELGDGSYELLDGHRRRAAAEKAGLPVLDALLRRPTTAAIRLQQQLAMHTHARAFNPIAEARALHELMFTHNQNRDQIAAAIGRPRAWVRDRIALVRLTDAEQEQVVAGTLSIRDALVLLATRRAAYAPAPPRGPRAKATTGSGASAAAESTTGTPGTAPAVPQSDRHCPTCSCAGEAARR